MSKNPCRTICFPSFCIPRSLTSHTGVVQPKACCFLLCRRGSPFEESSGTISELTETGHNLVQPGNPCFSMAASVNTNDANGTKRLEFVKRTLVEAFGLEVLEIKPVAYEEEFPFPYNNFVFAVGVGLVELRKDSEPAQQPGTQVIPADESTFIFRLPNPISGYNDKVRVQNEVNSLSLARAALQPSLNHLIPRVYAGHRQSVARDGSSNSTCLEKI
nr:hypothetical protein CFP56_78276 [Quercus suber]